MYISPKQLKALLNSASGVFNFMLPFILLAFICAFAYVFITQCEERRQANRINNKVEAFQEDRPVVHVPYSLTEIMGIIILMENEPIDPEATNGSAVGILQMKPIAVDEINRITNNKYNFSYDDRYSVLESKKMCTLFLVHEFSRFRKKMQRWPTRRELACSWNRMSIFKNVYPEYQQRYDKIMRIYYEK